MMKTKKRIIWMIVLAILLATMSLVPVLRNQKLAKQTDVWSSFQNSLESGEVIIDGVQNATTAYLLLSREGHTTYGDLFAVFKLIDNQWECSYKNDFEGLKPWKIELADIDGDDTNEILIAVKKTTHYDAEEKNRMFIFNFDGEKLVKKWTGSQTAGDWSDFTVGNLLSIPGDELMFIEPSDNGEEHISIYYWFDFGFQLLAESENYQEIQSLSIIEDNRIQIRYGRVYGKTATLKVQDGKIVSQN